MALCAMTALPKCEVCHQSSKLVEAMHGVRPCAHLAEHALAPRRASGSRWGPAVIASLELDADRRSANATLFLPVAGLRLRRHGSWCPKAVRGGTPGARNQTRLTRCECGCVASPQASNTRSLQDFAGRPAQEESTDRQLDRRERNDASDFAVVPRAKFDPRAIAEFQRIAVSPAFEASLRTLRVCPPRRPSVDCTTAAPDMPSSRSVQPWLVT
jgi:hypothetical protein